MRTRLLLCLTVLGLASCTGSLRHSQLDAGKTGAPRTSSDYSLASPRWENWGGSRCLTHNANFGPANFAGIVQSSATISSQECFGAPIVVEESGTDLDQIYLVDKASNLYRFNWPTNTSLVIAGSFPKAPPSPPLDPCKSTPCVSFNGVISYEDDVLGATRIIGFDPTVGFPVTLVNDGTGLPTDHASPSASMPHISEDYIYYPTTGGIRSLSTDTRIVDTFSLAQNAMVAACTQNPLNMAPDWATVFDRKGGGVPCQIDCYWPQYDGGGGTYDYRYTTRGTATLPGDAPGLGGQSQGAPAQMWTMSLAWMGHLVCTTTSGLFYIKPIPGQDPHVLPQQLFIKGRNMPGSDTYISAPAAQTSGVGAPMQVYVVKTSDGGLTGRIERYSVAMDLSSSMTLTLLFPNWTSDAYANPSIFAPCVDNISGAVWVSSNDHVYAFNPSGGTAPVFTSTALGLVCCQPVMGTRMGASNESNRMYVIGYVGGGGGPGGAGGGGGGSLSTLYAFYNP